MTTVAEYLTTEYTLQANQSGQISHLVDDDAYPKVGTMLSNKSDNRKSHHFGEASCYAYRHDQRVEAKARPMTTPPFEDRAPADDRITAYDERHFVTYLRILDAAEEGADWRAVAQILFGLDAAVEPDRARLAHDSHLERARWMTTHGYKHLLEMSRKG